MTFPGGLEVWSEWYFSWADLPHPEAMVVVGHAYSSGWHQPKLRDLVLPHFFTQNQQVHVFNQGFGGIHRTSNPGKNIDNKHIDHIRQYQGWTILGVFNWDVSAPLKLSGGLERRGWLTQPCMWCHAIEGSIQTRGRNIKSLLYLLTNLLPLCFYTYHTSLQVYRVYKYA